MALEPREETSYQPIVSQFPQQNLRNQRVSKPTKVSLPDDIGDWIIPSNQIEIQEEIGRGAYGIVYKVPKKIKKKTNEETAIVGFADFDIVIFHSC